MALRPISDAPDQDAAGDADQSELDVVAKLISEESPLGARPGGPPLSMIERTRQREEAPKHTAAGWYPDDADPALHRYWDGHHLTGQTMRVDPEADEAKQPVAPVPAPRDADTRPDIPAQQTWTSLRPDGSIPRAADRTSTPERVVTETTVPERVAGKGIVPGRGVGEKAGPERSAGEPSAPERMAGERAVPERVAAKKADPGQPVGETTAADTPAHADGATSGDTPAQWADRTARAVARAQASGTPEAWGEVVSVAAVVSELAQTMLVAARAGQVSEQAGEAAEQARRDAEAAKAAAKEATQASQLATDKARQAQEAAKAASRAAADAVQAAQDAEREAPEIAERAEQAARVAASARTAFEGIEKIVAGAVAADTPEAWAEAHRRAAAAVDS